MKNPFFGTRALTVVGAAMIAGASATACPPICVTLEAVADNTLIEIEDGSLSNALGEFVFAGRVRALGGFTLRRGLIRFDVASAIPPNAAIVSVALEVTCTMSVSEERTVELRRVLEAWGEGTSEFPGGSGGPATDGDATWLHTFWPGQFWSTPGGSFAAETSGSTVVGTLGEYVFESTPGMVDDVQSWLFDPSSDHGWLLLGDEKLIQTAKGFGSRQNLNPANRPRLVVRYAPRVPCTADLDGDGAVNGADLGLLIGSWGPCRSGPGPCPPDPDPCAADYDGNGEVNGADLGFLIGSWTG